MTLTKLVWRELFERKRQMLMCFTAILLGITVVVAIKSITHFSEKAVSENMEALGANLLILPKNATLQDYYAANTDSEYMMSDKLVDKLTMAGITGLENMSPKLNISADVNGRQIAVTGILPKSELQAKASWGNMNVFTTGAKCSVSSQKSEAVKTLERKRTINELKANEVLLGTDIASSMQLAEGDTVTIKGKSFAVTGILPETGTIDDSRIFAHLSSIQNLSDSKGKLSVIEVSGCCSEIAKGMVGKLEELLPASTKVVTITQVVATQQNINNTMANLSLIFLIIIIFVGGAGIANYMYANVTERQAEIGTLMAIGAQSGFILKAFLLKSLILGLAGGIGGYLLGTLIAVILGPQIAGVNVVPMLNLAAWSLIISLSVTVLASFFPARYAARLDPVITLQEV